MDFFDTIVTVLGFAKKATEVYSALNPKEEKQSGFAVRPMNTQTKTPPPARLKNMEQILGMDMPQMMPVYKRFGESLSRDSQLASLQASNFGVQTDNFDSKISQTMTLADATTTRLSSSQSRTNKLLRNLSRG